MQLSHEVDYIITTSNDADYLIYPGVDNVIYGAVVRPAKSGPRARPAEVLGNLVTRAFVRQPKNVLTTPAKGATLPVYETVDFSKWDDLLLLLLPVLLGCDYSNVANHGIKTVMKKLFAISAGGCGMTALSQLICELDKMQTENLFNGLCGFLLHSVYNTATFTVSAYGDHLALGLGELMTILRDHLEQQHQPSHQPVIMSTHIVRDWHAYRHAVTQCLVPTLDEDIQEQTVSRTSLLSRFPGPFTWIKFYERPHQLPKISVPLIDSFIREQHPEPSLVETQMLESLARASSFTPIDQEFSLDVGPAVQHRNTILLRSLVPQSQDRGTHEAMVLLKYEHGAGESNLCSVVQVVAAECDLSCQRRSIHACKHVNTLLLLLAYFKHETSKTSLPCTFANPFPELSTGAPLLLSMCDVSMLPLPTASRVKYEDILTKSPDEVSAVILEKMQKVHARRQRQREAVERRLKLLNLEDDRVSLAVQNVVKLGKEFEAFQATMPISGLYGFTV